MSEPIMSNDVYSWPEFIAFMSRLGVALKADIGLTIDLQMDKIVTVAQKYHAYSKGEFEKKLPLEMASLKNEERRTHEPVPPEVDIGGTPVCGKTVARYGYGMKSKCDRPPGHCGACMTWSEYIASRRGDDVIIGNG